MRHRTNGDCLQAGQTWPLALRLSDQAWVATAQPVLTMIHVGENTDVSDALPLPL